HDDPVSIDLTPRAIVVTPRDLAVLSPPAPRRVAAPAASHAAAHAGPAHKPPAGLPPETPTVEAPAPGTDGAIHSGSGSQLGAGGDGTGAGGGGGWIDLTARPVPIDASSARVLPYTEAALRDRISGDVVLVLHVDAQGAVTGATVRKPLGHGLDDIAI